MLFLRRAGKAVAFQFSRVTFSYQPHYRTMASFQVKSPTVKLSSGYDMPQLGLGTWKSKPGAVEAAVRDAIDLGYRHFDCAHVYQNEHEVGEGLTSKIKEGVVTREQLFITSKLWNTMHPPEMVLQACKTSLKNLNVDYLDLYLIHWPVAYKDGLELFPTDANGKMILSDADYMNTWPEMERLVTMGLVRSIGVSNFNSQQVDRILKIAKIKPVVNQIECHLYLPQKKLIEFCKERAMTVTAYSPLGSPDRPWAKPGEPTLMGDEKLKTMAAKLGRTVAQVLLRFQIQRGVVVIPKTVHKERLIENAKIFDFELSKEDMDYLYSFDCNGRLCAELGALDHKHYPFHIEY